MLLIGKFGGLFYDTAKNVCYLSIETNKNMAEFE